jgi:uncharacterized membrane-anchored protein YitT (DUF2179 family)
MHLFFLFSCAFDGIKAKWSNIFFTTVPMMLVMIVNTVLYTISWCKIYKETQEIKNSLGKSSRALRATHDAAKTMSLFVLAFFVCVGFLCSMVGLYYVWNLAVDRKCPSATVPLHNNIFQRWRYSERFCLHCYFETKTEKDGF